MLTSKMKKVFLVIACCLGAAIILFYAGLMIYFITGKPLTEEDVKSLLVNEIQPQIKKMQKEYNFENFQVEVETLNFEIEHPTIFSNGNILSKGTIKVDYNIYYKSDSFTELETEKFDLKVFNKYNEIPDIDCNYISNYRYHIHMHKSVDDHLIYPHAFKSKSNNVYSFSDNIGKLIYKNGERIFGEASIPTKEYTPPELDYGDLNKKDTNDKSKGKTNTCASCGRSWPAGDSSKNYINISRTGFCKQCEENFHDMKKYLE